MKRKLKLKDEALQLNLLPQALIRECEFQDIFVDAVTKGNLGKDNTKTSPTGVHCSEVTSVKASRLLNNSFCRALRQIYFIASFEYFRSTQAAP